jgi:poly-gamma-glutamate synthesis protein (capsule biosynthesis protein)
MGDGNGRDREIIVHAVGDVFVDRPDPAEAFSLVTDVIGDADIVFGNCEAPLIEKDAETNQGKTKGVHFSADARSAAGLRAAGFNVMSCANNHICDQGPDVLMNTLSVLRAHGIATAGAGEDAASARQPAIVRTRHDQRVAVIAYASFFRRVDVATVEHPGIAVVGGETVNLDPPEFCSPGVASLVTSIPDAVDVAAMVEDITAARRDADLVLASFHWGDATRPSVLTDHELAVARLAIDAGADAVLGHHHHALRGVDVHNGKPIFYGLGNFLWDTPEGWAEAFSPKLQALMRRHGKYAVRPRAGYPRLPFHPEQRMSMISRCRYRDGEVVWFGFIPCVLRPDGRVEPLDVVSADGSQVLDFVRTACDDLQLPVAVEPDPDERVGGLAAVRVIA